MENEVEESVELEVELVVELAVELEVELEVESSESQDFLCFFDFPAPQKQHIIKSTFL